MCGRYSQAKLQTEIRLEWGEVRIELKKPRFNIAPGQAAPVIRLADGAVSTGELRWGLIPSWANDAKIAFQCINARSETVADRPAYRGAFKSKRCLVPADGFYEWQPVGKLKQPWRFVRNDGGPLLLAGLWEAWTPGGVGTGPEAEGAAVSTVETFTVLTTRPNAVTAPVHDRMPVILDRERASAWLDPKSTRETLLGLCTPADDGLLRRYPVSTVVNNARNDVPECIEGLRGLF